MSDENEVVVSSANAEQCGKDGLCRILSLDGGGAKGFYTLGVLKEIEGMIGCLLHQRFDLVFGTSTGAIIASLIALGYSADEIHQMYKEHVPSIMKAKSANNKTAALEKLAAEIFLDKTFDDVKTGIGIVATNWITERPMIFKSNVGQAHGRKGTFKPGFGVQIADAVVASCSAYPFFDKKVVVTGDGDSIILIDGGFCANNPTLYAIADAVIALKKAHADVRVVSVGVGEYPEPKPRLFTKKWIEKHYINLVPGLNLSVSLVQKTFEINTRSLDQLRAVLYKDIKTVRISDAFTEPTMATDLFEYDLNKLNILRQRGRNSFATHEAALREYLELQS
ncbi:patatin [Agrobacterium vitis]|uniref:patatin-like phospholipase family protein n=1 Tax=Agrobacterium vitis TaxID=373 RepID=UPI001F361E54|nr:patatin-like phospholipase family protein [Agrobacterium vitis]MCF1466410.1 patatin [Agrobacterium vitis]